MRRIRSGMRNSARSRSKAAAKDQRTVFYTALYHVLVEPNLFSDVDGRYLGMDGAVHTVVAPQRAQYANFSGWDVYRSQLQLLTWLDPQLGSDIAQSLLNQANQNGGTWDRWTHLTGGTSVMNGDPSAPAIADIYAFGGRDFDVKGAYASLLTAATVPTEKDLSHHGCEVQCIGQRPGLDQWLKLHYMPVGAPGWGAAADTLEMTTADFALSELASDLGDTANARMLRARSGWWRNLYNPNATAGEGYIQPRNADGTWPKFDPAVEEEGFVEGSGRAISLGGAVRSARVVRCDGRQRESRRASRPLFLRAGRHARRHQSGRPSCRTEQRTVDRRSLALRFRGRAMEDAKPRARDGDADLDQRAGRHSRQ